MCQGVQPRRRARDTAETESGGFRLSATPRLIEQLREVDLSCVQRSAQLTVAVKIT